MGAAWVFDSRGDGRDSEWTGKGRAGIEGDDELFLRVKEIALR